jgi:hypothetical protein
MRKLVFLAALISITIPVVAEPQVDASIPAQIIPAAGAEAQKTDSANSRAVPASKNSENSPLASGVVLRTTARLVDVGVVAYDKKGYPVVDLNPDDFQIFDNGRKQQLKFFSASGQPPDYSKATSNSDQTHRDGLGAFVGATDANKTEGTTTVLLIDSQSLAWDDLSYARQEVLRFLGHLPASDRAGIYVMKETGVQILAEPSVDHAHVAEVFRKWMPGARELAHAQEEERRIRQQFDTVRHPMRKSYMRPWKAPLKTLWMSLRRCPRIYNCAALPAIRSARIYPFWKLQRATWKLSLVTRILYGSRVTIYSRIGTIIQRSRRKDPSLLIRLP